MFYPNPYDILEVSSGASKNEINKAFKQAMKKKKYPLSLISKAHKCLLNSEKRLIADYLSPCLPKIHRFKRQNFSALDKKLPSLDILPEFHLLDEMIAEFKVITEDDKFLGTSRFKS